MRWEYLTLKAHPKWGLFSGSSLDAEAASAHLNRVGKEGWELVSAFDLNRHHGGSTEVVFVFKRPAS